MQFALTVLILVLSTTAVHARPQGQAFELNATDGLPGDEFAKALALDADSILVGSWQSDTHGTNSGTAYVFDAQTGEQTAQLASNNAAAFDTFGYAVDIQGNRAVVGSPFSLYGGATVFVRTAGLWTQEVRLSAFDGAPFDNFGYSVAIDGDTVAIGSFRDDDNGDSSGSVYVYRRSAGSWSLEAKLISSDGQEHDWFGNSVALQGDTLLVGTPFGNSGTTANTGVGYIFVRNGSNWSEHSKLAPAGGVALDYIGYSVDLGGDLALLGAPTSAIAGRESGASYVFTHRGGVWSEHSRLLPSDGAAEDLFGLSVATNGTRILVGSSSQDSQGNDSGAAYEFVRAGSLWLENRKLQPGDGLAGDNFGVSVALHGDAAVVGANWSDDLGAESGSAYRFDLSPPGRAFCFGRGSGSACPCGGTGAADAGCANSSSASGGRLNASGAASIGMDDFRLHVAGLPGATPALVLQGANQLASGQGLPAGDGLLCTAGGVSRSQVQVSAGGSLTFDHFQGAPFGQASYGQGVPAHYQVMYRDFGNLCSGLGFNLTNAWAVTWAP